MIIIGVIKGDVRISDHSSFDSPLVNLSLVTFVRKQ